MRTDKHDEANSPSHNAANAPNNAVLKPCWVDEQAVKEYGGVEVQIHYFLTSTPDEGGPNAMRKSL